MKAKILKHLKPGPHKDCGGTLKPLYFQDVVKGKHYSRRISAFFCMKCGEVVEGGIK